MSENIYRSKYFTAEDIDQRLLQGYYDDAVQGGYSGTKEEFISNLVLVLSQPKYKYIGNYDTIGALINKLNIMHGSVSNTANQFNGYFYAMVGSKLVAIFNEVHAYETDVWSQKITCSGIVLRTEVLRTEEEYSQYSSDTTHKYRYHRYVQKFVDAVSRGDNFDKKSGVKTFCRRHYLTGDNRSTWTPWYDVENPYVQTQNYGKKIALFGGSFAQNMAVNSSDYKFTHEGTSYNLVDYIAEKLGAVAFDDYAVGGQGMRCDDNSPFSVHLMNQLMTAQSKDIYDIYIIMGGVNDYWCDKVPLGDSAGYASGSSDDEEQNISYCGGLLKAIDYIRVNAPNAKIYTITPFKGYNSEWGWNPRTKTLNAYGNTFYEFVQAQKEVSQINGVPCLDLWAMQGFSGANASEHYISDLLHPNGNGYYKASEKIVEFVAHGVGSEVVDVQALMFPTNEKIINTLNNTSMSFENTGIRVIDGRLVFTKASVNGEQVSQDVIPTATTEKDGVMSAKDKTRLNDLEKSFERNILSIDINNVSGEIIAITGEESVYTDISVDNTTGKIETLINY